MILLLLFLKPAGKWEVGRCREWPKEETTNCIRLPHRYCRRNPNLNYKSNVKCLLCYRFCASSADLPRLRRMAIPRAISIEMATSHPTIAVCNLSFWITQMLPAQCF